MSWLKLISEEEATGLLKKLYDGRPKLNGRVANIVKAHSLIPESMQYSMDLYMTAMFRKGKTGRALRELIATYVSWCNNCHY